MSVVTLERREIVDLMKANASSMGMSFGEAIRAAKKGENLSAAANDILMLGKMLTSPLPDKAVGSQRIPRRK